MEYSPERGALRALFVLERLPLPVRGGADLRSLQLVRSIGPLGQAAVFALSPTPAPPPSEPVWSTAPGGTRDEAELGRSMLLSLTRGDGHPSDYLWSPEARQALDELVSAFQPDVAIVRLGARRALEVLEGVVPRVVYVSGDA